MATWGRKPSCICGGCARCRYNARRRARYQAATPEERQQLIGNRSREAARAIARALHEQLKDDPAYRARRAAVAAVRRALKAGTLERQACEACRSPESEAHHDDYSRPLDVRWLCRPCHAVEHTEDDEQEMVA